MRGLIASLAIVVTASWFSGCNAGDATGSTTPPETEPLEPYYEQNRGQLLSIQEVSVNSSIRWENQAEIVFNTAGSAVVQRFPAIRALRLSDLSTRTLDPQGSVNYLGYSGIEVSPDGAQIYSLLSKPLAADVDLFHVAPGSPPFLVAISPNTRGSSYRNSATGARIMPTPDSRGALYVKAPDSVLLYDVGTRTSRHIGRGCHVPIAVSPDGARLLCRTGNPFFIMTLSNGMLEPVSVPAGFVTSVFWGTSGVRVIVGAPGAIPSVADVPAGASTPIIKTGQLRTFERVQDYPQAWSRDGRKVAFVTSWSRPFTFDAPEEIVVWVLDTDSGETRRVAVYRPASLASIGQMTFSPDGQSLAYVAGSSSAEVYRVPLQ